MTDRTTINVSKEAHRKAKEAKQEDESWNEYIQRCIDTQADVSNGGLTEADIQHIINEVAATADQNGHVDSDGLAREVVSQLDYAQLANAVASEVEARMR